MATTKIPTPGGFEDRALGGSLDKSEGNDAHAVTPPIPSHHGGREARGETLAATHFPVPPPFGRTLRRLIRLHTNSRGLDRAMRRNGGG